MDNSTFLFPVAAITDKRLQASSIKLLVSLYFNLCPGKSFNKSVRKIALRTGMSIATTRNSLEDLNRHNYLYSKDDGYGAMWFLPNSEQLTPINRFGWSTLLQPSIRGTSCWVFLLLSSLSNDRPIELSYSQLCEAIGISRPNVSLVIKQLEQFGILKVERTHDAHGMHTISRYSIASH